MDKAVVKVVGFTRPSSVERATLHSARCRSKTVEQHLLGDP